MAKITPAAGIVLIKKQQEDTTKIITSNGPKGRLLSGEIIAIGSPHITDSGEKITLECKVGQTAWFLSYEGNYDVAKIDNEDIYFVLFRDLRGYGTI